MASFPDDFEAPTLIEKRDVSPATWDELHATLSEASVKADRGEVKAQPPKTPRQDIEKFLQPDTLDPKIDEIFLISDPGPLKRFGLTEVYTPRREPTVDIVFVHGLNGHPYDSWTSQSGCFWPADLLPDVLGLLWPRILTYGYNANVAAFTGGAIVSHAEMLAWNLAANRTLQSCSDRLIIFVCHSLGGLVAKRALIYSRSLSNGSTNRLRSVTLKLIVDEGSAAPNIKGLERIGIDSDHNHMCKFEDEKSQGLKVVAEAILRYSRQAPTVIAGRWA
ncbi:hypothetical protein ATERTT37_007325 [Aspergillus terreus]